MNRLLVAGLLVALPLAAGCQDTVVRGERVPTADVEQAATAVLHQVAADLVARPDVVCADTTTSDDSVPTRPATDLFLTLVTTGLTPAQRDALALDAGRRLWTSPATVVGSVGVLVVDQGAPPGGASALGSLVGDGTGRSAAVPELAERFGPRPSPAPLTSPLPDPGAPPACPAPSPT